MPAPWERYQSKAAGPWTRYGGAVVEDPDAGMEDPAVLAEFERELEADPRAPASPPPFPRNPFLFGSRDVPSGMTLEDLKASGPAVIDSSLLKPFVTLSPFSQGAQLRHMGRPTPPDMHEIYPTPEGDAWRAAVATGRTPSLTTQDKIVGTLGGAVQGAENVVTAAAQFLTSPVGFATLGLGAAPGAVRALASGAFAADMASHAPDSWEKYWTATYAGDRPGQAEALTEGLGTLAMAGLAGSHSYKTTREALLPLKERLSVALAKELEAARPAARGVFDEVAPPEVRSAVPPRPAPGSDAAVAERILDVRRAVEELPEAPRIEPLEGQPYEPSTEIRPAPAISEPAPPAAPTAAPVETKLERLRAEAAKLLVETRNFNADDAVAYVARLGREKELEGFIADNQPAALAALETAAPVETPPQAATKVQEHVAARPLLAEDMVSAFEAAGMTTKEVRSLQAKRLRAARNERATPPTEGARPAKEIKSELIEPPPELLSEKPKRPSAKPTPSGAASSAANPMRPDFPQLPGTVLGGLDILRPMETPEILRLANEITSQPAVAMRTGNALGRFMGAGTHGRIKLAPQIFSDPKLVAQVLAHELGHANDFFPEGTLKRGNLIGRLVGSVHTFLKGSFGELKDAELRTELKDLSAYWRPWEEATAGKSEKAYRNSAKELYADAISVLLNSPGLLEQRAPKFYKAFFEHLDRKPLFKEEFFALQDVLMRGPEAVLDRRLGQSREAFESGEAMLHEKLTLREAARNSFKDFLTKVRIQSLDMAARARRLLGSKDPRTGTKFDELYEGWKLDDNKNAADVKRIYHEMIQPVVKAGLDEHHFGQVLELQRIMGGIDAYRDMQAMRKTLGPERMDVLKRLDEVMRELERTGEAETQAIDRVILPLEREGMDFDTLTRYRQLRETQGTRAELANPQGRSPVLAEAELKRLLETMSPEQRAAVLESARKFRELIFERATEARDVGIINDLTYKATVVPNKDNYAAFRPLDKIEPYVTPMVRRARGTLSDIENPFITTLLKLQSLNNLIETQRLKNLVRDEMTRLFPADFTKAETRWTGRRREAVPPKPDQGRVKILENGRLVEYNTDPYIAKVFERVAPVDVFWMNKLLEVPFRLGVYPLIIKYNPGFLFAFNPRRDMARTIRNLYAVEGVTRRELLPNYADPQVLRAVNDYLQGRPNPLADAMIRQKAITPSWQGFARIDQQDVMTDLLRRYRQAAKPEQNALMRGLLWLPEKINQGGSFLEALPKFASYKTLIERGVGPERAAWLVRNYVGTPNFKVKGEFGNVSNSWVPFLNIFLQGWRADLRVATSPKTAAGWWFQWALQHGWQAVAVGLATAGVFGDDIKRLFAGISEYDRTNYGTIPVGTQPGGEFGQKTVYVRLPRDETSRFFSALTYKATRALADQAMGNEERPQEFPTEAFAFGAGMTPGLTPMLNVAGAWTDYLSGRNPVDPFRNQPVIGEREFKAGGGAALEDMTRWTLQQSGVLNLIRWDHRAETTTEMVIGGTPVVNRLLKVSDQGHRERQRDSETVDAQARARFRLGYSDDVQSVLAQEHFLAQLGKEKRTAEQERRYWQLHVWKVNYYDPRDAAAWHARDTDKAKARDYISQVNTDAKRLLDALKSPKQTP